MDTRRHLVATGLARRALHGVRSGLAVRAKVVSVSFKKAKKQPLV